MVNLIDSLYWMKIVPNATIWINDGPVCWCIHASTHHNWFNLLHITSTRNVCWAFYLIFGNIFDSPHLLDSWREFLIKPPHIWNDDTSRLVTECMIGFRQNLKLSDNYWNCDFSLTPCLSQHVFPICSLILYHFTIDHGYPWYKGMTYNGFSVKFWSWNIWARDKRDAIFVDDIFKCNFLNENVWFPIKISPKCVPKCPINNIPALVQIMAWRRTGDKPLSEPMMT